MSIERAIMCLETEKKLIMESQKILDLKNQTNEELEEAIDLIHGMPDDGAIKCLIKAKKSLSLISDALGEYLTL